MKTKVLIISFAILCLAPWRLAAADGAGDYTFYEPAANGPVFAVATTADGHIWMGGCFNSVNGSAHSSEGSAALTDTYYCLALLNTNGTLDTNFTFSAFTSLSSTVNFVNWNYVSAIAVDPGQDSAYVAFSPIGGSGTAFIARFVPTGLPGHWSLDSTFTANTLNHINGVIWSMAVGAGGALYVAASVYDSGTDYSSQLGRFDTSGVLDDSYTPANGWNANNSLDPIFQVRYYPGDSSLLLAGIAGVGDPTNAPYPPVNAAISCADKRAVADQAACPISGEILGGGTSVPYMRFWVGGNEVTWTAGFRFEMHRFGGAIQTPAISDTTNGAADQGDGISRIEALPDGDSLIAGKFSKIHGSYVNNFAHLLPDGTVDSTFDNNTVLDFVFDMTQEPDGKYLLAGYDGVTEPIYGGVWGTVERRELLPTNHVNFVSQPQADNQTVYEGDSADLYAQVSSWPGLLAQWRKDGNDLAGQTNTSLYLDSATPDDSGQYSLFVQNKAFCSPSALSSNVTLTVLPAPPAPANDMFANAIVLDGAFVNGLGTLRSATLEAGETTDDEGFFDGRSVWWTWTAPFSGMANVDVSGCDFPAAIAIFTGDDVSSLTLVTNNYDYALDSEEDSDELLTNFSFEVNAGTTYHIAIGGAPNADSLGDIVFGLGSSVPSWAQPAAPTEYGLYGVAAGNHRIVAVGDANTIITSTDGENWTADTVSASISFLNGATYGNGIFITTGDSGAILTSTDGINWTQRDSDTTNGLWGVAFGNGRFVAAGDDGTIVTSPDGVNWTQQTNGVADLFDGVAYGNGLFVAVGAFGEICTSTDGTNWVPQNSTTEDEIWGITSGNEKFVAVGDDGDILTSPDGTNWTWQDSSLGGDGISLNNVSFGDGHFVTVGDSGTLLLSTDGTNWIADESGTSDDLYAVSYFGNGSFVIVGDNGAILFNQPPRLNLLGAGNGLTLELNGLNGSTAIIEASPSLLPPDWEPVATNVINHGLVVFSAKPATGPRYYRARIQ